MTTLAPPPDTPHSALRTWKLTALIAALLLLNFFLRLPTAQVADWGQFAFYDPGTVIKGDILLSKGYIPTIDFGYTHGLLSLLYGHIGFAVLGRTPAAFLALTLLTEFVMAWALARLLVAARIARLGILIFCVALPMAIMPAYLTLTHPFEAMFILLALAEQAEKNPARSLALMTACLFVKPSMAYVYGLLLVLLILWQNRARLAQLPRQFLPALIVLVLLAVSLSLWMGMKPVANTLLPMTGAKTYAATGFGFFNASGRAFWLPPNLLNDFITPAAAFVLASSTVVLGAILSALKLSKRSHSPSHAIDRRHEMLLTIAALHTTFLLGFYGWTGSWTYYSYLPILGLVLLLTLLPMRQTAKLAASISLIALFALSHTQLLGDIAGNWQFKTRSLASADLWAYPDQIEQWQAALHATAGQPTLLMTNGYLPNLPANIQLPDAWFPEPGIPTPSEIARVKTQADHATCIIVWWEYRTFDLWNSPDFANIRINFHPIFQNDRFTILQRN